MKAFVTGATGMLGNNLIRLLLTKGYDIKALVRSKDKAAKLLGDLDIDIIQGDMSNVATFANELEGVDLVFHTAAYFRESYAKGDHWPKLRSINVDGTRNLLEASEEHKVKKFIHVSSSGTIGKAISGKADETTAPSGVSLDNPYFRSKVKTDKMITEFLETHSLAVTTILPGWMFGPYDAGPTAAGQLVLDFLNKKLPASIQGGAVIADVRDVCNAMFEAVGLGVSGEKYIVAGELRSMQELMQTLSEVSNVSAPRFTLPKTVAIGAAWLSERFNPSGSLSVEGVKTISEPHDLSSAKAQKILHANFRPFEEPLRDTVNWYKENGYV